MYAARLWWMLRFMGHDKVAVLDGGIARWIREGHAVRGGREQSRRATFVGAPRESWRLDADAVASGLGDPSRMLVDARAEPRYRGDSEPLDKKAGHIPGARNYFFQRNLDDDKTFKSPESLRTQWESLLGGTDPRTGGDVLRFWGDRVSQPAGPRACRPRRRAHLPGVVERMVEQPQSTHRNRRLIWPPTPGPPPSVQVTVGESR